ncbi:MAG: hypothetical protein JWR40_1173 [Massilia sp.]|jgi:hypothetical protein|nr:hypothetical protein [Massilia sp.]MDB5952813.1 hypothetical protein [Massilia sp.]
MKRLFVMVSCALALGGCSMFRTTMAPPAVVAVPARPAPPQLVDRNGVPIERIAFRPGVSSVTVEKLGKLQACTSDEGAGLVTEAGPVEVYRIACSGGKVFMARCELRQCKAM